MSNHSHQSINESETNGMDDICHIAAQLGSGSAWIHARAIESWTCLSQTNDSCSLDKFKLDTEVSTFTQEDNTPITSVQGPAGILSISITHCEELNDTSIDALRRLARLAESVQFQGTGDDRYQSFFEHLEEGIFQTTPDGRYISANPKLAKIYGYDSAEQLVEDLRDISGQLYVQPGRRDDFVKLMREEDVITNFESQIRRVDGSEIWISENVRAVRDDNGEIQFFEGTVVDITDQRQVQDDLRDSELLYHSLVETIPQNILRKDLNGRFIFANQRFCELLGHQMDEIIGRTDHDFFPKDLADKYRRDDQRVIEKGEIYDTVEEHDLADGTKMYVHVIKTPLRDAENNLIGIQCMFWDVTSRRQIEDELAFERDLLHALLENVPDRIYFKDTESRFVRCSQALARRLGLESPEDAVGKTDYDFHPKQQAKEFHEDEQRVVLTGKAVVNKAEKQISKDGQATWASVTKVPVLSRAGIVTGLIGISRDITALKLAEQEMERARDLAEESAQLKAQFLATMSHEIRTPMNAIIGMVDLLLSTHLDAEQQEYAGHVRTSADALLEILNDILDLSKIEAGQMVLEKTQFNLRELVEDAVELHALKAQEKGVELACHVPSKLAGTHKGDTGRLRQVLLNFISNAVKFTEHGTVRVTLTCQENGQVRFEVRDTGIGIASDLQPKIFEAFRQADGSTTRKYGGTGLGLAISQELVELMGGTLGVESEHGSGSLFWFSLPLEQVKDDPKPHSADLTNRHLTIAAADGFIRRSISGFAEEWEIQVESFADGESASKHIMNSEHLDIVLLDLDIPGIDCLDLVQLTQHAAPNAHVLLITTRARKFDPNIIRAMGVAGTITKPVKCRRMKEILCEVLSGKSPMYRQPELAGANRTIHALVVEDNQINQRVAQLQLEKLGCRVSISASGEGALELDLNNYDLIFMDCQMPGMDGFETTRTIREREKESGTPTHIIAMTANAREEDRQACLDAGMDDFVSKPVQLKELQRVLGPITDGVPEPQRDAVNEVLPTDTLRELLPLYIEQARKLIASIKNAASAEDFNLTRQCVHQLKGSSANVGARALADLCSEIEIATAEQDPEQLLTKTSQLDQQMDLAESALNRLAAE